MFKAITPNWTRRGLLDKIIEWLPGIPKDFSLAEDPSDMVMYSNVMGNVRFVPL